jgi:hypothetical protein
MVIYSRRVSYFILHGSRSRYTAKHCYIECAEHIVFCIPSTNLSACRRFQSPIIPVRCGPHAETFPVHRDILTKSEYFRKALEGEFREAGDQAIDLPEEDPSIFSFVIAYLYEGKFVPIKPVASVLGK